MTHSPERKKIREKLFGLEFDAVDTDGAAEIVMEFCKQRRKGLVVTPNVDQIVRLDRDHYVAHIYSQSIACFADGMPLIWLSRLLNTPLPFRVTGADLLPKVCEKAKNDGLKLFFLGGKEGVANRAAINIRRAYPGVRIDGAYSPPFGFENDRLQTQQIIQMINRVEPDILCVGVGFPKQEKWAFENLDSLKTGPILCIGAALDFAAGLKSRAPSIVQNIGAEWLWRLSQEPRRLWRRYLINDSHFFFIVLRELARNFSTKIKWR